MIQSLPLKDQKVLVPREKKQAKSFSQMVEKYGGIPVEIPLLAFRPVSNLQRAASLLEAIDSYDWILFTSNVTIEILFKLIGPNTSRHFPKIAVIGKKTAEVLQRKGLKADFLPSRFIAETFVEEFLPYVKRGMKILIPKGNLARDYIAEHLRKSGAVVEEAVIYETYLPEESRQKLAATMANNQLDILLFTSSSTVDHFMGVIKEYKLENRVEHCLIGCIGPVTEKKLKSYGLNVHAAPKVYTVEEMIKSMIAFIEGS